MADEREQDRLWKRIDCHGRRLSDVETGLVEVRTQNTEQGRQMSDLSSSITSLRQSIDTLRDGQNQMIGGMRSLRWIGIGLGVIIALSQLINAIGGVSL